MLANQIRQTIACGWNADDETITALARDHEDIRRALGHPFYDWRTHGGTYAHFLHLENDE